MKLLSRARRVSCTAVVGLTVLGALGTHVATADDDPFDPRGHGRMLVEPLGRESAGGWTVELTRNTDTLTRAQSVSHVITRTPAWLSSGASPGPGDRALRVHSARGRDRDVPLFRLNPSGWVAVTQGTTTTVFAPDDPTGAPRNDIEVTSASRFLAGGFLSVSIDDSMRSSAAIRIAWAPFDGQKLGPARVVARVEAVNAARVLAAAHVVATESGGGVEIVWTIPETGTPRGGARIDTKTGDVTPIPARETVRVAAVQCASDLGATRANLERIVPLVDDAARGGAKFVVLPETAATGYLSQDLTTVWQVPGRPRDAAFTAGVDPKDAAEKVPGTTTAALGSVAARWGIWLTAPLLEVVETPATSAGATATRQYFNTVVLMDPDGKIAAHYRKLTPWPHPEQSWATAGDLGLAAAETPYGRVGLAICFDVHAVFPRYAKDARRPWALLYPIAWVSAGDDADWFSRALPERVRAAGFHVVGANWSTDRPQPWHGAGFSTIVRADGTVLSHAKTTTGSEIVFADLPAAR